MVIIKSTDIRNSFIDFFKANDHVHQPSAPVIPLDDPTLLFVNAGMNQFKDVFTGSRKVSYARAVSSQKCIRAGGKHNDLENVGRTSRHHTFFEMLGNFSFGDYFKEEAIVYAWEWFTKVLKLPTDKLYATVYNDDDQAFELWEKVAPELKNGRILRFGKEDNYWSMGNTGPCGPCSEIHFDMGEHLSKDIPKAWINNENDRFIELWNLVFMQYDQVGDGKLEDLPKPSVDTGAGLERIAAVMQGVDTNYETDLFTPLTALAADITGVKYETGPKGVSHRVMADHVRALAFALADGGGLSNEGRGYVLRRILRRAARHGRKLGYKEPIICKLVPTVIEIMGGHFTELGEKQKHIEAVIRSEEERFGELLDTGLELFSTLSKKVKATGSDTIPGEDIFKLYDTFGFPADMTALMAEEAGLKMDMDGFKAAMSRQQEQSRAGAGFEPISTQLTKDQLDAFNIEEPTEFVRGENSFELETEVEHSVVSGAPGEIAVVLKRTPFYVESGGQIGDVGLIEGGNFKIDVKRVREYQGAYIHSGEFVSSHTDHIEKGTPVTARIDKNRRLDIMRNHTATHLLHAALRQVVGDHVKQSGSLVDDQRLRFDFAHFKALTPEEIAEIEKIVNEKILEAIPMVTKEMPAEEAMKSGAMALFGEKYGDTVRVVSAGDFSSELCGGTHVTNTAEIGSCLITVEAAIASGVRRIEAVTGREAALLSRSNKTVVDEIGTLLNVPADQVIEAVRRTASGLNDLQKENKKLKAERFSGGGVQTVGNAEKIGAVEFLHNDFGEIDQDSISGWSDNQKGMGTPVLALAIGIIGGKRAFIASASKPATEAGYDVGRLFGGLIRELGGRGGGKANFARGSLPDDISYDDLIEKSRMKIKECQP
ncbi:MAG: alanine--tRNA ligase [FCB group bacterium]|nr:alanine--tRNA ligase [FCB group bacterium]